MAEQMTRAPESARFTIPDDDEMIEIKLGQNVKRVRVAILNALTGFYQLVGPEGDPEDPTISVSIPQLLTYVPQRMSDGVANPSIFVGVRTNSPQTVLIITD